jgi:hypothetical protein
VHAGPAKARKQGRIGGCHPANGESLLPLLRQRFCSLPRYRQAPAPLNTDLKSEREHIPERMTLCFCRENR